MSEEINQHHMSFMQPLKKFINEQGVIYTVRRYQYSTDQCYISGVGNCKRELIGTSYDNYQLNLRLNLYFTLSGFKNKEDWITMIKRFTGSIFPLYLYKVEKIKENN